MKPIANITLCFLLLFFTSCWEGPYQKDFTIKRPAPIDVTGLYTLKQINYAEFNYKTSKNSFIRLNNDGTYEANKIPNILSNEFDKEPVEITTKGRWKIDSIGLVNNLWGQETIHWGITISNFDEEYGAFGFMGSSAPYELIYTFDDPSLGFAMIFKKSQ